MATERQTAANRANAKRSSGPKSRAGKTRVKQNAYRHGLAACMVMHADQTTAVHDLAREIQASLRGQIDRAGCLVIAQAEFEVLRVRAVLRAVFADLLNGLPSAGPTAGPDSEKQAAQPLLAGEKLRSAAADVARGIDQLRNLNRYLRRVIAQRDRAVRLALEHVSDPSA